MLTVHEKLEILKSIKSGTSYRIISEKFGIARSTVADIKKEHFEARSVQEEDGRHGLLKKLLRQ